tara:strand:+ start:296 stop:451 length:156 start_codon:yes stop_codon:yes gene_type:complete
LECWKNKRGTDIARSPDVEDMGEEFGLGTKSVPPDKEEKKYFSNCIEAKLK